MSFTSQHTPFEIQGNTWHRCYDSTAESVYYWNEQTNQNAWSLPKKIKPNWESFIPVESFISSEKSNDTNIYNNFTNFPPSGLNLMCRCYMCNTQEDVKKHGYCKPCYDKINSPQEPLISKFKIKCQGCHGWGLNLVKDHGYCAHCYSDLTNGVPVHSYEETQPSYGQNQPQSIKCARCGGWGKDLVKENGKCAHCTREETRLAFEAKWKTTCKTCGGWGLGLVKEDGLCNHCRRLLANERVFFSKVISQKPIRPDVNFRWAGMDETLLGKRVRNHEDDFEV